MISDQLAISAIPNNQIKNEIANNGEVFTNRWMVEFILDLVQYSPHNNIADKRIVDPACGDGVFISAIAQRVARSCSLQGKDIRDCKQSVSAFDISPQHVHQARRNVVKTLDTVGVAEEVAHELASSWIHQRDFLLDTPELRSFDFVVGNPPYIRQEDIPNDLLAQYRKSCQTMKGRADLYVGFFEKSLGVLVDGGVLGFICADRWMRNSYGRKLRDLITTEYSVDTVLEAHDVDAFERQVSSYPAITVIRQGQQGNPLVGVFDAKFDAASVKAVIDWANTNHTEPAVAKLGTSIRLARVSGWFPSGVPWPSASPERLTVLKDMESRFEPLESEQTRIGIGVATGADAIYITDDASLVESEQLLPIALTRDTRDGFMKWSGHYLVNPWDEEGNLVNLSRFPLLSAFFESKREILSGRHVASKQPHRWFRTIDPVHADLTARPKLLFPDMKLMSHPVLDPGGHYPHHNLYYIVSSEWDLEVLGGLLMSKVGQMFIEAFGVKMRGGTLRFQAQYLRRIRVPTPAQLTIEQQKSLRQAFRKRDTDGATTIALEIYGLESIPD